MTQIDRIKSLSAEIVTTFKADVSNLKLTAEEEKVIKEAADALAAVAVTGIGADAATIKTLAIWRKLALAAMENIAVTHGIRAEELLKKAVSSVITSAFRVALEFAIA